VLKPTKCKAVLATLLATICCFLFSGCTKPALLVAIPSSTGGSVTAVLRKGQVLEWEGTLGADTFYVNWEGGVPCQEGTSIMSSANRKHIQTATCHVVAVPGSEQQFGYFISSTLPEKDHNFIPPCTGCTFFSEDEVETLVMQGKADEKAETNLNPNADPVGFVGISVYCQANYIAALPPQYPLPKSSNLRVVWEDIDATMTGITISKPKVSPSGTPSCSNNSCNLSNVPSTFTMSYTISATGCNSPLSPLTLSSSAQ
jgi:hypothetical protein